MSGRFYGGKSKSGKRFAWAILHIMQNYKYNYIVEPFVGGGGLTQQIMKYFPNGTTLIASDINRCSINFLQAVASGWVPPTSITPEQFYALKETKDQCTPLHFVIGYYTCFNGRYFADNFQKYTNEKLQIAARKIPKFANYIRSVQFYLRDYRHYTPRNTRNALIICDPPYYGADRTQFLNTFKDFDYEAFYEWVKKMSTCNYVLFCDSVAPKDFVSLFDFSMMRNNKTKLRQSKKEYLFAWKNPQNLFYRNRKL